MEIEDTGLFWEVDDKDGGIVKKRKDDILTLRCVILCNIFHNIYFPKKYATMSECCRIGGAVTFANFEAVMEGVASACNGKEVL